MTLLYNLHLQEYKLNGDILTVSVDELIRIKGRWQKLSRQFADCGLTSYMSIISSGEERWHPVREIAYKLITPSFVVKQWKMGDASLVSYPSPNTAGLVHCEITPINKDKMPKVYHWAIYTELWGMVKTFLYTQFPKSSMTDKPTWEMIEKIKETCASKVFLFDRWSGHLKEPWYFTLPPILFEDILTQPVAPLVDEWFEDNFGNLIYGTTLDFFVNRLNDPDDDLTSFFIWLKDVVDTCKELSVKDSLIS
jgi:hypothetical protein